MRFKILLITLLTVISVCLIVIAGNITDQNNEINTMRNRLKNLETVINHDYKIEIKTKEKPKLSANRI